MEVVKVVQYESETSDEEIVEGRSGSQTDRNQKIRKGKQSKFWIKEATFDQPEEAEASIKSEWAKHYTNYTENGRKVYYRCKKAKRRGPQCSASICLLYHADSDQVTVSKSDAGHDHLNVNYRGIDENVK